MEKQDMLNEKHDKSVLLEKVNLQALTLQNQLSDISRQLYFQEKRTAFLTEECAKLEAENEHLQNEILILKEENNRMQKTTEGSLYQKLKQLWHAAYMR
ncbi:MAG: hypothetical protein LUH07_07650 [Lachnospiraceae bacterium]|nr:hypothetical protein [Lachnospiraceae bacterium]